MKTSTIGLSSHKTVKTGLMLIWIVIGCMHTLCAQTSSIICALGNGGSYDPDRDINPTVYAMNEGNYILSLLCPNGCGQVQLTQNESASNALTVASSPGVSKVSYNPNFMNLIWNQIGSSASFGILAHEIGHHIDLMNPEAWQSQSWGRELRADAWAGCAMARAGLNPTQMDMALRAIARYPSVSHPGWQQRLNALYTGYQSCSGLTYNWPQGFR